MTAHASSSQAEDRDAITAIILDQGQAWNCADAHAFGRQYREDGSFTNVSGLRVYGKAGFVNIHERIFQSIFAGSQIRFVIDRFHFLRPDVAVVEIDATLTGLQHARTGAALADDGSLHSKLQEVFTRDEAGWQIAAFHNVAVARTPALGPDPGSLVLGS